MDSRPVLEELLALCLQRINIEEDVLNTEKAFIEVVKNFEASRKKWLHAELELKKYKELLVKSDIAKAALEVKLKHARNQLDVEMKKRFKIEADYQYLRQMQLMCDILIHDSKSSGCLNDEQKSLLATFEQKGGSVTLHKSSKRLSVIDESSFLSHSDISYDRTDDDVDVDTAAIKPLRSRARERRRSSMGLAVGIAAHKKEQGESISTESMDKNAVEQEVQMAVKALVMIPETITQESQQPHSTVTPECSGSVGGRDQTSVWSSGEKSVAEPDAKMEATTVRAAKPPKHFFISKTVIRPETCSPCGKRIRFGKIIVKCRNCRVVAHPECQHKCVHGCSGMIQGSRALPGSLEAFAPLNDPRIPQLIVECVNEIEKRGLEERGLYRVPGNERLVKELRDRYIQRKIPLMLNKVDDIHVVCGFLKDFLRKLNEPLITFKLHRTFMEASEISDEDNSAAVMYQAVENLPKANRTTLAFLMLHLQRVMRSSKCQMDQNNLARVFGPTIVGHGTSEPCTMTIIKDVNTQPKVVGRLLSLPEEYWRSVLANLNTQTMSSSNKTNSQGDGCGRFFEPLTSPELNIYFKTPSRSRLMNLGSAFTSSGRAEPGRRFFTSPV